MITKAKEVTVKSDGKRTGAVVFRRDSTAAPTERSRIQVTVTSDLHDRWEGLAETMQMWGDKPNIRYLSKKMAKTSVREEVAEFFNSRAIVDIMRQAIPTPMFRPSETLLGKDDYITLLRKSSGLSEDGVAVVAELTIPAFIALKFVSPYIRYSSQVRYGFDRVTVAAIRLDVTVFQVLEAVKAVSIKTIDANQRISKAVFAEQLGEIFRPIGLALYEIIDLSSVVDDLVVGVRAVIDPAVVTLGSVPSDWRTHRVVNELAQNLTFVRQSLTDLSSRQMRITNDMTRLERWAPVVLAAIKSSERYQWVGKAEALRHISTRKVRNLQGRVVTVVVNRRVEAQAIAQSVIAVEDRALQGSFNVTATNDQIATVVQSAYGTANFSSEGGARMVAESLMDGVQMGWNNPAGGYMVDANGNGPTMSDIAVMLSSRLYVSVEDDGVVTDPGSFDGSDPVWWFVVPTTELSMKVMSGTHLGTEIVTCDPVEAIMAHQEMIAKDALPPRPQMLSAAAFNTRVVDFQERLLQRVDGRYSFDVNVLGVALRGSFKPQDLASLRAKSNLTSLVSPHFNEGVITGLQLAFETSKSIVDSMVKADDDAWLTREKPTQMFFDHLRIRAASSLLKLAQQLSPAFRNDVQQIMIDRSIVSADVAGDAAARMRAELGQKTFGAYADVIALHFFMFLQGIDTPVWLEILSSTEMQFVAIDRGTDRDKETERGMY